MNDLPLQVNIWTFTRKSKQRKTVLVAKPEKIDGSSVSDGASMLYHIATSVDETVEPIPKPQVEPSKI